MTSPERASPPRPALYMLWDSRAVRHPAPVPDGYELIAVASERLDSMRPVVELDGALTTAQWDAFAERILPDGLFAVRVASTQEPVGVISAVHNPRGGRFYFPGGGELGYLVVEPAHRGRGLGRALVAAALARLRSAGYRTIWLGVQEWRLSAIRTYLRAGFVPFLHAPDPDGLAARWNDVFRQLGQPPDTSRWRRGVEEIR